MNEALVILTENANGIWAIYGGCVMILLLVTLHRIRRVDKRVREVTGSIADMNLAVAELMNRCKAANEGQPTTSEMESAVSEDMAADANICKQKEQAKERPEELIDAVLGEVFP